MANSGRRIISMPRLAAMRTLLGGAPRDREEFTASMARTFEVIGSPAYPMDEARKEEFRAIMEATWDRGHDSAAVARQLHAITCSGDRTRRLRRIQAPTLVIHGDRDPLVRPAGGRALARAIPGARLRIFEGMGHDMPPELFERFADEIASNAARARAAREPALSPSG
jgi:pimeloyl-ACP methyl ester carboxylesterase